MQEIGHFGHFWIHTFGDFGHILSHAYFGYSKHRQGNGAVVQMNHENRIEAAVGRTSRETFEGWRLPLGIEFTAPTNTVYKGVVSAVTHEFGK